MQKENGKRALGKAEAPEAKKPRKHVPVEVNATVDVLKLIAHKMDKEAVMLLADQPVALCGSSAVYAYLYQFYGEEFMSKYHSRLAKMSDIDVLQPQSVQKAIELRRHLQQACTGAKVFLKHTKAGIFDLLHTPISFGWLQLVSKFDFSFVRFYYDVQRKVFVFTNKYCQMSLERRCEIHIDHLAAHSSSERIKKYIRYGFFIPDKTFIDVYRLNPRPFRSHASNYFEGLSGFQKLMLRAVVCEMQVLGEFLLSLNILSEDDTNEVYSDLTTIRNCTPLETSITRRMHKFASECCMNYTDLISEYMTSLEWPEVVDPCQTSCPHLSSELVQYSNTGTKFPGTYETNSGWSEWYSSIPDKTIQCLNDKNIPRRFATRRSFETPEQIEAYSEALRNVSMPKDLRKFLFPGFLESPNVEIVFR